MKKYEKITKTYETEKLTKCMCDRCKKECNITDKYLPKYSNIEINPRWASEISENFQLCPECTRRLLEFFTEVDNKIIEEFKDDMKFWLED